MRTVYCRTSIPTSASSTTPSSGVFQPITTKRNILLHVGTRQIPDIFKVESFSPTDFHLVNKSLPWDYAFRFVIEEISNINDKAQTMSISMYDDCYQYNSMFHHSVHSRYFAVSWFEPRLRINKSASEWTEDRTGPLNVNISSVSQKRITNPFGSSCLNFSHFSFQHLLYSAAVVQ